MIVKDTESFITKASIKHNNFYTYDKTVYVKSRLNVTITCPFHGDFEQIPNNHLNGAGCNACSRIRTEEARRLNLEIFLNRVKEIHGDRYDYSKVVYTDIKKNVGIICKKHGVFQQTPDNHLQGKGCRKCGRDLTALKKTNDTEYFIEKAKEKHENTYNYSKSNYTRHVDKITITCKLHGDFTQKAGTHLRGSGCSECHKLNNSFSREKYIKMSKGRDTILYLIKCKYGDEEFYKIGKTYTSLKYRFRKNGMPYSYELIDSFVSKAGEIYDMEINMHTKYLEYKHTPLINFKGYTECYGIDLPIKNIFKNE